jgi:hypothetical protein
MEIGEALDRATPMQNRQANQSRQMTPVRQIADRMTSAGNNNLY